MGVSCKCCAQQRNWREMLSAIDFKSEISDLRSENAAMRSITQSIERTSPADPRAMYKNAKSSFVVPRSNPYAILLETESAARSIWSRRLRWRRRGAFSPTANMRTARLDAACQTGRSSNRSYFIGDSKSEPSLVPLINPYWLARKRCLSDFRGILPHILSTFILFRVCKI
jgi:hypothetical protein